MDSNTSNYLLNQTPLIDHPFIDLGLSLNTFHHHHHHHHHTSDDYNDLIDWNSERKERLGYVKVNMDGMIVGRKICMLDHVGYSSLVLQLEDMFGPPVHSFWTGKQSISGIRLFQPNSEYFLAYMDRDHESWMAVGDHVPWKEFAFRVKRLRIARKS
ncbi:auxin-responsive protein IAA34-like [Impatiens glandulifera]|uniref:auxin-responsive protein IAA34-like n=1 Tax=Impatiens glandulifera TaxID=253017 RepID=UPI001FB08E86|nr:auxin-responsive protein IAA34-like [Impatiens glandulifera]